MMLIKIVIKVAGFNVITHEQYDVTEGYIWFIMSTTNV